MYFNYKLRMYVIIHWQEQEKKKSLELNTQEKKKDL